MFAASAFVTRQVCVCNGKTYLSNQSCLVNTAQIFVIHTARVFCCAIQFSSAIRTVCQRETVCCCYCCCCCCSQCLFTSVINAQQSTCDLAQYSSVYAGTFFISVVIILEESSSSRFSLLVQCRRCRLVVQVIGLVVACVPKLQKWCGFRYRVWEVRAAGAQPCTGSQGSSIRTHVLTILLLLLLLLLQTELSSLGYR